MASIEGVVATRPGWLEQVEVVEVHFDPRRVSYERLVKQAAEAECAVKVFTRSDAQQLTASAVVGERAVRAAGEIRTDDDKFYLSRTPLKHVPLTQLQASRINALVGEHEDPTALLVPVQRALLERIRATPDTGWPVAIGAEFLDAWKRAHEHAGRKPGSEGAAPVR